jgi:hypothetical protein
MILLTLVEPQIYRNIESSRGVIEKSILESVSKKGDYKYPDRPSLLLWILEKAITDEMVGEKINKLKPHHLVLAALLERVHEMNLEETIIAFVVIEGLRWLLKIHAARLAIS